MHEGIATEAQLLLC